MFPPVRLPVLMLCLAAVLAAACAAPPSKEMNQAQGAIDAARAAGADAYAHDELQAAVDALAASDQAVEDRDYRLALSHALDSRERAQNAARLAVDKRAEARGNAERTVAELAALLTHARARLKDPEVARLPARVRRGPGEAIDAADKALQEARAALDADAYDRVAAAVEGQAAAIEKALEALDEGTSGRRKR